MKRFYKAGKYFIGRHNLITNHKLIFTYRDTLTITPLNIDLFEVII